MGVDNYSPTPNNNSDQPPFGAPENWLPSDVNDVIRQIMADIRAYLNDGQWFRYLDGDKDNDPANKEEYVSSNVFKINGTDSTAHYHVGRRVKIVGSSTVVTTITAVSYGSGATNVTVEDAIPSGTIAVYTSQLTAESHAMPLKVIHDIVGGMVSGNTESNITVEYQPTDGTLDFTVSELAWGNITGKPTTFTPSAHDHNGTYYTETEVDSLLAGKAAASHTHDDRYYTETEIDAMLAGLPVSGHNHDDRYYTETEMDSLLSSKASSTHNHDSDYAGISHAHDWGSITGKPATFTPTSHSHAWADITGKPTTFAPTAHGHAWGEITGKPSTFTPSAHNHDGVYALSAHSHSNYVPNTGNSSISGVKSFTQNTNSSSKDTGAIVITAGGLGVEGNVYAGGDFFAFNTSDLRKKHSVNRIEAPLEKLRHLTGNSFFYKDPDGDGQKGMQYGLIAQEVRMVMPEMVDENDEGTLRLKKGGFEMIALLVESVNALTARVEELEGR